MDERRLAEAFEALVDYIADVAEELTLDSHWESRQLRAGRARQAKDEIRTAFGQPAEH